MDAYLYLAPENTPAALPGVGECNICCEPIPFLKILDCGHGLCIRCVNRMIDKVRANTSNKNKLSVSCPECRSETDVSLGVQYLPSRYFGKIKCDLCLGHKETEDMWWCKNCVQAICSKCSIKEHSRKDHRITEWNKLDPVGYSIEYIEEIKVARQESTTAEINRRALKSYLQKVEERLQQHLALQPELEELKECLLTHYGTKFQPPDATNAILHRSSSSPGPADSGQKVVAKVLQLAGANVQETVIPSTAQQSFQVYFSITPEEVAKYLASHVEFIPLENGVTPSGRKLSRSFTVPSNVMSAATSADASPSNESGPIEVKDEISFEKPTTSSGSFSKIEIASNGIIAFMSDTELVLCNTLTGQSHRTRSPTARTFRYICFNQRSNDLILALQSTVKSHEWFMESWNVSNLPYTTLCSLDLDIDPEDKVLDVRLFSQDEWTFYEIRNCVKNVSEIWQAVRVRKRLKEKVKEVTLYQKPGVKFVDLQVVDGGRKEKTILAYEEFSQSLQRMVVRNQKCEMVSKILNASDVIPYCLDNNAHIWIYDQSCGQLCTSQSPISAKGPVRFLPTNSPKYCISLLRCGADGLLRTVSVGPNNVIVVTLKPC